MNLRRTARYVHCRRGFSRGKCGAIVATCTGPPIFAGRIPFPEGPPYNDDSLSPTVSAGWASESMNAQLRQKSEEDRLQQELQVLREEIRIKDSRMKQLEAHRRPYYPPVARLAPRASRAVLAT